MGQESSPLLDVQTMVYEQVVFIFFIYTRGDCSLVDDDDHKMNLSCELTYKN
jgi:hypothetical protein